GEPCAMHRSPPMSTAPDTATEPVVPDTVVCVTATLPASPALILTPPAATLGMGVTKRNGAHEPVDLNKIVRAIGRCCEGLHAVDPMRVATRTISGLYDGATTRELDE